MKLLRELLEMRSQRLPYPKEWKNWDGVEKLVRGHAVHLEGAGEERYGVLESEDKDGDMPRVLVVALDTTLSIAPTERCDRKFIKAIK